MAVNRFYVEIRNADNKIERKVEAYCTVAADHGVNIAFDDEAGCWFVRKG